MKWLNKHLNWSYIFAFVVALIILVVVGFMASNVTGYLIFLALNLLVGGWVISRKGHSLWYLVLVGLVFIAFPFVVLFLKNRGDITHQAYLQREKELKEYQEQKVK